MATPIPENRARFTVDEVARATGGVIVQGSRGAGARAVVGVTSDSRSVEPGSLFVALRGEVHDGHAFAARAAERGAAALVLERRPAGGLPPGLPVVEVPDTLVAWGGLARAHLERWRAGGDRRVVAVTGSAGKTTTKELLASLLDAVAPTHFTAGNLNNRIGVPAVIFALEPPCRFAVLEVGMSLVGELDAIMAFARPDVSIIVNVGVAHAEGVGGREGVMREKGAVYRALAADGVAIVNADDEYVERAASLAKVRRIVTFGRGGPRPGVEVHYQLAERSPRGGGAAIVVVRHERGAERRIAIELPLPGEAAAIDLTAALAATEMVSGELLAPDAIQRALDRVRLEGRGSVRRLEGDGLVIDDTYNANPSSMRAALSTLSEIAGGRRRVAILGEMRELGALAEEEHRSLGDAVAEAGVRLVIGCGGLVDLTLERAAARGVEAVRAATTEDAAREATARVRAGDAILVKGSRGVRAEDVVAALAADRPTGE